MFSRLSGGRWALVAFLWPALALAQSAPQSVPPTINAVPGSATPNALTMLTTFGQSIPALWDLTQGIAAIMAMGLFAVALFKLKKIGDRKSDEGGLGVILTLIAGTALMYLSTSIGTVNQTLFGSPSILAYSSAGATSTSVLGTNGVAGMEVVIGLINLVGLIAFIRGWYALHKMGSGRGGQEATGQRVAALLIGGTLCLNIVTFSTFAQNTFGITSVFQSVTTQSNQTNVVGAPTGGQ